MFGDQVACSFCGNDPFDTLHMIENGGVYICRDCVVKGVDVLTRREPKRPSGSSVKKTYLASELGLSCAFCDRKLTEVRAETSISHGKNHICDECLMICFDIILRRIFGHRQPSRETFRFLVSKLP